MHVSQDESVLSYNALNTVSSRYLRESDLRVDLIMNGRIGNIQPGKEGKQEKLCQISMFYVKY